MLSLSKALAAMVVVSGLVAPVQAGMYPSDGPVINLDAKGFKKVMASEVSLSPSRIPSYLYNYSMRVYVSRNFGMHS